MRSVYVLFVALVCVTSQASEVSSAMTSASGSIPQPSGDRTRRDLSDMAARRRSSLDKNFMRFGRSSNFMRFGRSDEALDALRALRCMQLLNVLRKLHESERLQKRAVAAPPAKSDKYVDRRNDNFMRLGRGARDNEEDESAQIDTRAAESQINANADDKYRPERNAMYMDDRFLRMGRDFDDSSAEDVIEIDLPDEKY